MTSTSDERWYLPGWGERLRLMGWRNVLWLLPAGLVAGVIALWWIGIVPWSLLWASKFLILAFALPFGAAIRQSAVALQRRADPFCIHCGYSLVGRDETQPCPECGAIVSEAMCRDYQRDPHWYIARHHSRGENPPADVPLTITTPYDPTRGDGT